MRIHQFLVVLVLAAVSGCAPPANNIPALTTVEGMSDADALSALGLTYADVGYHVIDAETGESIAAKNPDGAFPPASTIKMATMIAALDILGPEFRFRTRLGARGQLDNGALKGDLVLSGDGDPLLSAGDLRALAVRLRDIGVRKVEGRFLVHSTIPTFPEVSASQPLDAPYNQGISGLNVDFNRVHVSGENGKLQSVHADGLVGETQADTSAYAERPVRAPTHLAGRMFRAFARAEGIDVPALEIAPPPPGTQLAAEIVSRPLLEIARSGLEYSNNLVAEVVGWTAAHRRGVTARTLEESALALGLWLEDRVPNLSRFAQNQRNHSGLNAESRVSPRQMTALLEFGLHRRHGGWRIDSLLPAGGGREGYRGRFRHPITQYRVWGKTGSMRYIKGITGYLDTKSGRKLAFAIFTFDPDKRAEWDNGRLSPPPEKRRAARVWRDRVERFEEAKISQWISNY